MLAAAVSLFQIVLRVVPCDDLALMEALLMQHSAFSTACVIIVGFCCVMVWDRFSNLLPLLFFFFPLPVPEHLSVYQCVSIVSPPFPVHNMLKSLNSIAQHACAGCTLCRF